MEERFERYDLECCVHSAIVDVLKKKGYTISDRATARFAGELVEKIIYELECADFVQLKIEEEEEEEKEYGKYHHDEELGETYIY